MHCAICEEVATRCVGIGEAGALGLMFARWKWEKCVWSHIHDGAQILIKNVMFQCDPIQATKAAECVHDNVNLDLLRLLFWIRGLSNDSDKSGHKLHGEK